jgi:glyoxylase-like metal-dependent hydrolase (beta-lactamase superfamily II)
MDGRTRGLGSARLVCHCLLVEAPDGLVLVDTGIGLGDIRQPRRRMGPALTKLLRVQLSPATTAVAAVERLGFSPSDVRHIVLTHLDFDHAGGILDFPAAQIHVMRRELDAACHRTTPLSRQRYRPAQWHDVATWQVYDGPNGEPWFGFEAVRELVGLPPEVLLIPLPGHTFGHAGIAVRSGPGWLLHAGDAYFYEGEMNPARPHGTPGLDAYQFLMEVDRRTRLANQQRLRALAAEQAASVRVFCAHDAAEFDRLADERELRPVPPPPLTLAPEVTG